MGDNEQPGGPAGATSKKTLAVDDDTEGQTHKMVTAIPGDSGPGPEGQSHKTLVTSDDDTEGQSHKMVTAVPDDSGVGPDGTTSKKSL